MSENRIELKIDWATHKAAAYACKHWHYSGCMPRSKMVKIGAWENGKFIGVVLFSRGASYRLLEKYELNQGQGCELTRVALTDHKTPVTKIMSVSISMLKKSNPNLKLVISFADPLQNHLGIVYQAGNWIYTGKSSPDYSIKTKDGIKHRRSIFPKYGTSSINKLPGHFEKVRTPGKHRYLMPLTKQMRKKIMPLSKPYPKACKVGDGSDQEHSDGSTPICTLQKTD